MRAKAGSTFTFEEFKTDSNNTLIAGSLDTVVTTILRADVSIAGKTGVLLVVEQGRSSLDTSYVFYEDDNDISILRDNSSNKWITVPVGTGSKWFASSSSTSTSGGVSRTFSDSTVISLLGTGSATIKAKTVSVKNMEIRYHYKGVQDGVTLYELVSTTTTKYAPSLGYFTSSESVGRRDPLTGDQIPGTVNKLIDYDLK